MKATKTAPGLLVAMPQLADPYFTRSVVLLLHHDEGGAMGLMLNQVLELSLDEVASQHGVEDCQADGSVRMGGPVDVFRGFVVHRGPEQADDGRIAEGTYISGSVEVLRTALSDGDIIFQLFLGYAGWGPEQLDDEIAAGSWLSTELEPRFIFDVDPEQVWQQVLASMGIDPVTVMQGGEIA